MGRRRRQSPSIDAIRPACRARKAEERWVVASDTATEPFISTRAGVPAETCSPRKARFQRSSCGLHQRADGHGPSCSRLTRAFCVEEANAYAKGARPFGKPSATVPVSPTSLFDMRNVARLATILEMLRGSGRARARSPKSAMDENQATQPRALLRHRGRPIFGGAGFNARHSRSSASYREVKVNAHRRAHRGDM